jgi:hypothetical protein
MRTLKSNAFQWRSIYWSFVTAYPNLVFWARELWSSFSCWIIDCRLMKSRLLISMKLWKFVPTLSPQVVSLDPGCLWNFIRSCSTLQVRHVTCANRLVSSSIQFLIVISCNALFNKKSLYSSSNLTREIVARPRKGLIVCRGFKARCSSAADCFYYQTQPLPKRYKNSSKSESRALFNHKENRCICASSIILRVSTQVCPPQPAEQVAPFWFLRVLPNINGIVTPNQTHSHIFGT